MVLIYIFLIISDVEHLLMCLFAICISCLEKMPILPIFLNWVVRVFYVELYELKIYVGY